MFKVVETFSGIGAQAKALERIGKEFEIVNTADWDINAILAYCMIHKGSINVEKYTDVSDAEVIDFLGKLTLSADGKKPMNAQSFARLPIGVKRMLYAAIKQTNNFVSITDVKGEDIPEDIDLFTYSFPCQDLSLAGAWHGNTSGIARDAHNRSGMLWEVERILLEMHENNRTLPRFLVMENVCNILSKPHEKDFGDWKSTLERLGYYNKIYRLNAKNFGIPQKRERAYMISVNCYGDDEIRKKVQTYFEENNLESETISSQVRRRRLTLSNILRTDYSNPIYKAEADANKPNNTPSRQKIFEDNDILVDSEGRIDDKKIVNTVTTKQDRNPNSGLLMYDNGVEGKTTWRYLTPRECFMLMGFDESDYNKVISNNPQITKAHKLYSSEKLIKMAGNSIVVDVLEALFKQILAINDDVLGKRNEKFADAICFENEQVEKVAL